MVYELENAILSSLSLGSGSGDKPVETLTINYRKITWTFTPQREEGGREGEIKASWDVSTNEGS